MAAKIEYTKTFTHPNPFSINGYNSQSLHYVETDLLPDGCVYEEFWVEVMFPDSLEIIPLTIAIEEGRLRYGWNHLIDNKTGRPFEGLMEIRGN